MRVTTAVFRVSHTLEVVTQIELAAIIRLWYWYPGGLCGLFHVLTQVEPCTKLEVGERCRILHRYLGQACGGVTF